MMNNNIISFEDFVNMTLELMRFMRKNNPKVFKGSFQDRITIHVIRESWNDKALMMNTQYDIYINARKLYKELVNEECFKQHPKDWCCYVAYSLLNVLMHELRHVAQFMSLERRLGKRRLPKFNAYYRKKYENLGVNSPWEKDAYAFQNNKKNLQGILQYKYTADFFKGIHRLYEADIREWLRAAS